MSLYIHKTMTFDFVVDVNERFIFVIVLMNLLKRFDSIVALQFNSIRIQSYCSESLYKYHGLHLCLVCLESLVVENKNMFSVVSVWAIHNMCMNHRHSTGVIIRPNLLNYQPFYSVPVPPPLPHIPTLRGWYYFGRRFGFMRVCGRCCGLRRILIWAVKERVLSPGRIANERK